MAKKVSEWNKLVQKIFKERKCKTLGEAMQIASALKKQGKNGTMNKSMNKSMKKGKKGGKTRRK
jgi:hypothetical protein